MCGGLWIKNCGAIEKKCVYLHLEFRGGEWYYILNISKMDNFVVSARKYRPSTFATVVGQEHITRTLKNAILTGQLPQAFLFCGPRGVGKTTCARILAKTINCEHLTADGEACNECASCRAMADGASMNIFELDAASNNSVDDIRELVKQVYIPPQTGRYKVYIIDEVHMLSAAAFNAFLKTLEEPPAYVVIMLLTTNSESFLQTIRSRCVELDMKPVQNKLLKQYLMEELEIPDYKADVCVAFAQGNVGKAREMAMSDDFTAVQNATLNLVKSVRDMDLSDAVAGIKAMSEYKVDPGDYLDIIAIWYRDVLLFKATGETDQLIFREELSTIRRVAQRSSYEGIEDVLEALRKARIRLSANVNFDLTMELLLLTIQEKG